MGSLLITLMVSFTLMVPVAMWGFPHLRRWQRLSQLTSSDLAEREVALNWLIRAARSDERVREGAMAALEHAGDEANFLQIVEAMDLAGVWERDAVPAGMWLRWTLRDLDAPDPATRVLTAIYAGGLVADAGEADLIDAIESLLADADADVRYNALVAAVRLASVTQGETAAAYRSMIRNASADPDPTIARHAWLFRGLMSEVSADEVGLSLLKDPARPASVREAALWAAVSAEPSSRSAALVMSVLGDPTVEPRVRAMAAYCVHPLARRGAGAELYRTADFGAAARSALEGDLPTAQVVLLQRIVLAADPAAAAEAGTGGAASLLALMAGPGSRDRLPRPLLEAAVHAAATSVTAEDPRLLDRVRDDTLLQLAALEGLPVGVVDPELPDTAADIIRIAATAAAAHPDPDVLRPALRSDSSAIRTLAAVTAADRLSPEQAESLTVELLKSFNDRDITSGMILAGLTGHATDLLRKRHDIARSTDFEQLQTASLALWMQDAHAPHPVHADYTRGLEDNIPPLLESGTFPLSVTLLALLHRDDPRGLDHLLGLTREPSVNVVAMLRDQRFWHVLRRYLPADAPPFWLWADPQLQAFQVDVLRDWWVVRRATGGGHSP